MQEQKTLADLAVGDEVAIRVGIGESYYIHTIRSLSRGIIELEDGDRYRVTNGTPLAKGDKWHRPDPIQPVTEEIRLIMRKSRLVHQLSGLDYNHWKAMDIETLEAIVALAFKEE